MTIAVAIVALAVVSPLPVLPGTHAATVLPSEFTVLQALKREWGAFNGSETWTSSTDCTNGDMKGVACSFFGEIYALGVFNKGIKGSIPTSIGTLQELQFLDLSGNQLTGPLPSFFAQPGVMNQLDLSNNQLSGSIPAIFSRFGGLLQLRLNDNQLSGTIPEDMLAVIGNINILLLHNNQLTGSIPARISNLEPLQFLDLSGNQLDGNVPVGLSLLTNLQLLKIGKNQITGVVPSQLAFLTRLNYLYLNDNSLSGSFPTAMMGMNNIVELSLANNQLVSNDVNVILAGFTTVSVLCVRSHSLTHCMLYVLTAWSPPLSPPLQKNRCVNSSIAPPHTAATESSLVTAGLGVCRNSSREAPYSILPRLFSHPPSLSGDCWAYAVVGSIEMAYGILSNLSAVPLLSVSQLRDALGSSCSQGNSPSQAFQYLITLNAKANIGLMEDGKGGAVVSGGGAKKNGSTGASPLCSIPVFAQLSKPSGGPFRVNGFERTAFHGWFGLLLAVQRQPVVVHVQATAPSFLNHDGLSKYADPSCFTYNLNHVVLLVGYRLTGSDPTFPHMAPPFWIIRNSWGPEWGDGGHMRMDIQGGDGVCGINTLPGIYPVVRAAADPCNVNGTRREEFGSLFNPCGNFTCTVDGSSNRCDCNDPRFVEARNPDNTRTCAYKDACRAAVRNPCAVGTCVNDGKGSYSCVCPPGFRQGTTVDGTFSCGPGDSSSKYTVVLEGLTCADIHPVYSLTLAQLQAQNPGLSCSAPLAVDTVVNVVQPADLTPCSVYYTTSEFPFSDTPLILPPFPRPLVSSLIFSLVLLSTLQPSLPSPQGDTCESLATYFSITAGCPTPTEPCAEAFQALNPGLDCSGSGELLPSQAVCVERRAESAAALLIPVCSQFYLVQAGETCDQIRSVPSPPLSPLEFFRLNPGIKCSRLVPKTDVGSLTGFEVCSPLRPHHPLPCIILSSSAFSPPFLHPLPTRPCPLLLPLAFTNSVDCFSGSHLVSPAGCRFHAIPWHSGRISLRVEDLFVSSKILG
ncbi:unnamed protein product [Closterium sp. Naga37s-1]|nr:unnamed protein product [Closterium sp. Naga37s-1]